jgi:hypothetical protein
MTNFEEEYKDHLLCIRRWTVGTGSGFTAYAMKFREPGNPTEPFAGRVSLNKNFTGQGARLAAYEAIKKAVDESIESKPELNSFYAQSMR